MAFQDDQNNPVKPIPMIAPDGTPGMADPSQAQTLANQKYTPGVLLRAPDGTRGVVHFKDLANLKAQGYMSEGEWQQKQPHAAPAVAPAVLPQHQSLWDRFTSPLNIQSLHDTIKKDEDYSTSVPTLDEAANHPITTPLKKGLSGFLGDATKMFASPAGIATSIAAPFAPESPLVRAGLTGLGLTFGASGIKDVAQHGITPNADLGEQDLSKYTSRILGDAAAITGGAAGVAEVPHVVESLRSRPNPSKPTPTAPAPEAVPPVDRNAKAAARVAQAAGGPKGPTTSTINVDPAFAGELQKWQASDLPNKRIILKPRKDGTSSVQLVHSNPDVPGYQYTDVQSNNVAGDAGPGTVPVDLSKTDGVRGTSKENHFLSAKVPEGVTPPAAVPTAAPPVGVQSTDVSPLVQSQPEAPATPAVTPEDVKLPAPPEKPVGGASPGVEEAHLPETPKIKQPEPPSEATVESTPSPETPKTPAVDVSPLEDKMRPAIGKLLLLKRLRTGEAASHAIDKAIDVSKSVHGEVLDPDTRAKVSALLNEPVGDNITPDQAAKLEARRGATKSGEPSIEIIPRPKAVVRGNRNPQGYLDERNKSLQDMIQAYNDPNIDPKLKAKIERVWTDPKLSEGHDGAAPDVIFHDSKITYPEPFDTPADHPEAPFISKQLGHSITPLTVDNLKTALGASIKSKLNLESNDDTKYVTQEELDKLYELAGKKATQGSLNPSGLADNSDVAQDSVRSLIGLEGDGPGSVKAPGKNSFSPEYQDYYRQLTQRVLDRKIGQVQQDLLSKAGQWSANKGQANTPLTDQLAKLSDSAKKLLPKELFDAKNGSTPEAGSSKAAVNEESTTQATAPKKVPTIIRPGSKTPTEGIKWTKSDEALQKANPAAAKYLTDLHSVVEHEFPQAENRQSIYAQASKAYHDGVIAKDPYALKKAMDIVRTPSNDAGFLNLGPKKPFSPSINAAERAWNVSTANSILERWESMPDTTLAKSREGLWKGSLQRRIDQSAPVSIDPVTRALEAEEHNDLLDRLSDLKQKAGKAPSLYHSLQDWARKMVSTSPAEGVIRSMKGTLNRDQAILAEQFRSVDRLADTISVAKADRIWDYIQKGENIPFNFRDIVDPDELAAHEKKYGPVGDINDLVSRLRDQMDQARDNYTKHSGNLSEYLTNYMAGEYTNVGKARAVIQDRVAKSEMYGDSDFLKQKTYQTQVEALAHGLDPITNNFVRRSMLTIQGLRQAAFPFELRNQFVDSGYAKQFDPKTAPPEDWQALDSRTFGSGDTQYYAPETIARTFNNFVSKGLAGGLKIPFTKFSVYDAMRYSNNIQNMAQLSFSMFHLSDIVANSFLTSLEVGGRRVLNEGVFGGRVGMTAAERAKAAVSGVAQLLKTPISPIQMYMRGRAIELNYRDPFKQQGYDQMNSDLETANAGVRPNNIFQLQQMQMFKSQWQKVVDADLSGTTRSVAAAKAIFHTMATVPELSNYPLMNATIPVAKLGTLDLMFEQVHREYANAHPDILDQQLQKASDSVDDRFGEMNMDNIFWPRTLKDIAHLVTRSIGWTFGTVRQIGGGIGDVPRTLKDIATGAPVHISPRTAYLGAMVATTMVSNAVFQYMRTGQLPHTIDYFYPKEGTKNGYGEDNRVYPKFLYTYDPINYYHDPLGTLQHKMAPGFSTLMEIKNNEDYYHHQIWEPGGKPLDNFQSLFSYMARAFTPFTVDNTREGSFRGSSSGVLSTFGIMPAPQWVGRSDAANLAFQYFNGTKAQGAMDPQTLEKQAFFLKLRNQVNSGEKSNEDIQKALDSGKLNPKMVKYLYDTKTDPSTGKPITPPLVTWLKPLRSESEVWNVWNKATPEEKKQIMPTVIEKLNNLASGDPLTKYMEEIQKFADANP